MRVDENNNFWVTDRIKEVCSGAAKIDYSADLFSLQLIKYKGYLPSFGPC